MCTVYNGHFLLPRNCLLYIGFSVYYIISDPFDDTENLYQLCCLYIFTQVYQKRFTLTLCTLIGIRSKQNIILALNVTN